MTSAQHRDPFKHWDKQDRREFGETVTLIFFFLALVDSPPLNPPCNVCR